MAEQDRPLPVPPSTPFGKQKRRETGDDTSLLVDRMYMAMAEGKGEEFLSKELGDNPHAIAMARMMMGFDGMGHAMPAMPAMAAPEGTPQTHSVPDEVIKAASAGDVQGLAGLLMKYAGVSDDFASASAPSSEAKSAPQEASSLNAAPSGEQSHMKKDVLDAIVDISREECVSVDWLMARALMLYVREYKSSGRL